MSPRSVLTGAFFSLAAVALLLITAESQARSKWAHKIESRPQCYYVVDVHPRTRLSRRGLTATNVDTYLSVLYIDSGAKIPIEFRGGNPKSQFPRLTSQYRSIERVATAVIYRTRTNPENATGVHPS